MFQSIKGGNVPHVQNSFPSKSSLAANFSRIDTGNQPIRHGSVQMIFQGLPRTFDAATCRNMVEASLLIETTCSGKMCSEGNLPAFTGGAYGAHPGEGAIGNVIQFSAIPSLFLREVFESFPLGIGDDTKVESIPTVRCDP